ncbi:MAG: hypothetical protein Q8P18_15610 [Pseudomonadota bacterium]|nr:hypothetical protein [Pseudomonadota bacterium]
MYVRLLLVVTVVSLLACSGGPEEADVVTPPPLPVPTEPVVEPAPPPEEPLGEEQPPAGGWIQDEVIYDAEGKVYGCVGGGNWCGNSPPRDPVTHQPRPR